MTKTFDLTDDDMYAISVALIVAKYLAKHPRCSAESAAAITKAIAAMERMPDATPGLSIEFGVCFRAGDPGFEEMRYVSFLISEDDFEISSGGTINMGAGGDNFSDPTWLIGRDGYCERKADLGGIEGKVAELLNLGAEIDGSDDNLGG